MMKKYKYTIEMSSRYKKELKKMLKRGADESKILAVVDILAQAIHFLRAMKITPCTEILRG